MPTLACPFCSKPMRTDNGLKWHMENIHGQAHDSSESNVPTVGSDAPDERHTPASDHGFPRIGREWLPRRAARKYPCMSSIEE